MMSRETPTVDVYIHIPFCRARCPYCDFVSNAIPGRIPPGFITALCEEIYHYSGIVDAASVFIGGGTPSLLSLNDLDLIFQALTSVFVFQEPEITLEANPDDVSAGLVRGWQACGINRISLGVQSFGDETLRYLGRRHDAAKAVYALDLISEVFSNWNMDLIFGAPARPDWANTLKTALRFKPPHVAAYSLTYEMGAPFGKRIAEAPDGDAVLAQYKEAESCLAGYDHYEISNFALPGFQCRHNLIYWHNEEYVGFGPGAYSYLAESRMRNVESLSAYMEQPGRKSLVERLSIHEQQVETLIQHFRLREGLSEAYYQKRFGEPVEERFSVPLDTLQQRQLLQRRQGRITPTPQGFYLNDEIGLLLVDSPVAACDQAKIVN